MGARAEDSLAETDLGLHSPPARQEGVSESELDPLTRRKLLILQHGLDAGEFVPTEPPFPARRQAQVSAPRVQSRGGWLPVEEEITPRKLNRLVLKELPMSPEPMQIVKHRPNHLGFCPKVDHTMPSDRILHENQRLPKVAFHRDDRLRFNQAMSCHNSFSGEEPLLNQSSPFIRNLNYESGQPVSNPETPLGSLQEIAMRCGTKVEFRPALGPSTELQFSVEAWLTGGKVGEETGRTRREAQLQAAGGSLKSLTMAEIFSEMQMDEVCDAERKSVVGLAEQHVYKSITGIPAEKFIEVRIHLSYFGNRVSVKATDTEVKFTTVNREVVFRNQPHGRVECFIGGVEPEHPISFSFNLYKPHVIVNACKLSSVVWFLYTDGPWPTMLNCPVGSLGNLRLYIAGVATG